ncbi:putative mitochondrial hypothetical protein [Leptomonas pyrrhocoris]|uniref:Uncharacterized protein n=1 Tax=Leptomonas pyrrhocoris TaxID=157538 RepID=A0A0M9FZC0_LEPPY|nr:putative mitochondrial hypothetical protein [Leptomonas pyrrhocoris]KPA78956.1 putative mitochondrial hypothetical protein [Leptomonas pyrrhocoris]|eukprot:XP_015657395.1 putative mitochondrial hypothetical protein [Leptomonas pyrrhocoris]
MSGDSLAAALSRLNSCHEAADIIYGKDAAQTLSNTSSLPNTAAAAASRDEFSVIVARRIGTMVARLNDLASPASQVVLTPRMVLCELMDVVRQALYASLPPSMQQDVPPTDKAGVVRLFNTYASTRQVPLGAAAEGLYAVSYVSVKLRVELVALQLHRRIREELTKKDTQASEGSVAALVVTETLLEDFMAIYNNIVLTLPITKATAAGGSEGDGAAATAAAERLVPVFLQYFYQLCDWVLVLESTMKGPVMSYTQVKRLSVDEQRGTVVVDLHRPTPQTAWGLLLNEQGCLVDIDVSLRVFEKAKQLHHLLQAAPQGALITKINEQPIPPVRQGNHAAYAQKVVETLQAATAARKNVQLSLQSTAFKAAARTLPMEVAFVAPPQGGEGTSGQRVTLVLRRQSTAADWGFTVDERLYWHPPPTRTLSDAAKNFVKDYGRHLRLLAVNGVEALHTTQVELLLRSAETVVLELLVMPTFERDRRAASRGPAAALTPATEGEAAVEVFEGEGGKVKDKEGPKVSKGTRHVGAGRAEDDAQMEATVAKFLQRRTAATVSTGGEAAVAMETPLVDAVMARPSPTVAAAAAAAAEKEETKRKRGRPCKTVVVADEQDVSSKKVVAADLDTAPAAEDIADPNELPSSTNAEGEEVKAKPRRGRPCKNTLMDGTGAEIAAVTAAAPRRGSIDVNDTAVQKILATFADDDVPVRPRKAKANLPSEDALMTTDGKKGEEAACVFDNTVRLLRLTDEEMVLERPSVDMPWGLPIGRIADAAEAPQQLPLRLMSLPPAKSAAARTHPFVTQFKKDPTTWFIAEVNGKPAANAEATLKSVAKLTRMTLRFLRK